jgi:hypothetical protein
MQKKKGGGSELEPPPVGCSGMEPPPYPATDKVLSYRTRTVVLTVPPFTAE